LASNRSLSSSSLLIGGGGGVGDRLVGGRVRAPGTMAIREGCTDAMMISVSEGMNDGSSKKLFLSRKVTSDSGHAF
jgi:hypothetical protein